MLLWKYEVKYTTGLMHMPVKSNSSINGQDLRKALRRARQQNPNTKIISTMPIDTWVIDAVLDKIHRTSAGRAQTIVSLKIGPGGGPLCG